MGPVGENCEQWVSVSRCFSKLLRENGQGAWSRGSPESARPCTNIGQSPAKRVEGWDQQAGSGL